jgi:hypothetical protein
MLYMWLTRGFAEDRERVDGADSLSEEGVRDKLCHLRRPHIRCTQAHHK